MVTCPVCLGKKVSPFTGRHPCLCCEGTGEISEKKLRALKRINKALSDRLLGK
jgi:DnaJ-class molecular chaperone